MLSPTVQEDEAGDKEVQVDECGYGIVHGSCVFGLCFLFLHHK